MLRSHESEAWINEPGTRRRLALYGSWAVAIALLANGGVFTGSKERAIDPDETVTFAPYQILDPDADTRYMPPEEIDGDFATTAALMEGELEGAYDPEVLPTEVFYAVPDRKEYGSGAPCFTRQRIGEVASLLLATVREEHGDNAVPALVLDSVDQCETIGRNGFKADRRDGTIAYASSLGYKVYKSSSGLFRSLSLPHINAHETGHVIGVHHAGKATCLDRSVSMLDPRTFGALDVQQMYESEGCYVIGTRTGGMNEYASSTTVMGSAGSFDPAEESVKPLFNTLDRSTIYPDEFPIETIELAPANYELHYGRGEQRNGVRIELPEDHVLRTIARRSGFDALVVTLDVTGGEESGDSRDLAEARRCGEEYHCGIRVYAESTSSGLRLELPPPQIQRDEERTPGETLLYFDKQLGIGLVEDYQTETNIALHVVTYDDAQAMAEAEYRDFSDLLQELRENQ